MDKLQIKVHEWPLLTDVLVVSPDGKLMLPLIGTIRAEGMSVAELAVDISKRLQGYAKLGEPPFASIEIVQFRPFYVTGDVQRPGEYPFRPGMTVLMAVSLSGGLYRAPPSAVLRPSREVIASEGIVAEALTKQMELLVRQVLLRAELKGRDPSPSEISQLRLQFQSSPVVEAQLSLFSQRRQGLADQVVALRNRVVIYQEQIKYLRLQIASTIKQRASVERELETQQSLVERGLGLAARVATLERLVSQIEGDQRGLETAISRAQDSIAALEAESRKLTNDREQEAKLELATSSRQLEDLGIQVQVQRKLIAEAEAVALNFREKTARVREISMTVSRDEDGLVRSFSVDNNYRLDPGDVLIIEERVVPVTEASASLLGMH